MNCNFQCAVHNGITKRDRVFLMTKLNAVTLTVQVRRYVGTHKLRTFRYKRYFGYLLHNKST